MPIEVQIRRPCSEAMAVELAWTEDYFQRGCLECGVKETTFSKSGFDGPLKHRLATEWVSLEKAIQMAHEEAALNVAGNQ